MASGQKETSLTTLLSSRNNVCSVGEEFAKKETEILKQCND